ncbi:hypothetical protein CDAR_489721 [Caerostris darwini]|uniref:Uncharacterized protein n=1 Tax=Caerostris darwini TaxID=1538125 RepID=A0AAV4VJU0_9ARAC|nr:hypothetical protein CDAR_489721 [Caerostris darwini]
MTPSLPSKHSFGLSRGEQRVSDRRFLLSPNSDVLPPVTLSSLQLLKGNSPAPVGASEERGVQKKSLKRMHPSLPGESSSENEEHCSEGSN